jgi:hypothetical protein
MAHTLVAVTRSRPGTSYSRDRVRSGRVGGLTAVVAGSGSGLVAATPVGPSEPVGRVVDALGGEGDEQAGDLVAGERDQRVRGGTAAVFVGADHGQERMGERCSGGPGVRRVRPDPCRPGTSPQCATLILRPAPASSAAPAEASSSGSRRVRRWFGCGGSAGDGGQL